MRELYSICRVVIITTGRFTNSERSISLPLRRIYRASCAEPERGVVHAPDARCPGQEATVSRYGISLYRLRRGATLSNVVAGQGIQIEDA